MKRIAIVAGLLLAAAALAGVLRPEGAHAVDDPTPRDTVTVSGNGAVSSVPDRAAITAGVESRAATAQAALAANAKSMQKIIDALKASGGKNVTTSTVSLSPGLHPRGQARRLRRPQHRHRGVRPRRCRRGNRRRRRSRCEHDLRPDVHQLRSREALRQGARGRGRGREGARPGPCRCDRSQPRRSDHHQRVVSAPVPALREGRSPGRRRVDAGGVRAAGDHRDGLGHVRAALTDLVG